MDTQTAPSSRIPPCTSTAFKDGTPTPPRSTKLLAATSTPSVNKCHTANSLVMAPAIVEGQLSVLDVVGLIRPESVGSPRVCVAYAAILRRAAQRDLPRLPEIIGIAPRRQPVKGQPFSQAARAALPLAGRAAQSQRTTRPAATRPAVTCSAATWSAPPPLDESGDQPVPAIPPTANAQFSDPAPLEPSIYGELRTDDHGEEDDSETEKESRRRRRLPRNPANRTTGPRTWAKAVKSPDYPQKTA
ncbi:hypothetical protein J6590_102967 [Homalodisca vitripennis]|nr:hypothetical protein J6590_102967 [Homalodisca vitripennis]